MAGAVPVDDWGRVILLRRGFDPGQGRWTFPGGLVDLGESVEEAAVRETTPEAIEEVRTCAVSEIPWEDLAFWSTERALGDGFGP